MPVPYTFGTATASIPLSQLDSNFATAITIGNTAVQLGNTVTTLNNMTLANVTISSGNVTITNVSVTTANATTANVGSLTVTGNAVISGTDNTNAMLRITQLGTGNALLVEDSTNPDSTPFVIDSAGNVIQGTTASATGGLSGQTYQQHVTATISSAGALFAGWNATQPNSVNIARSTSGTIGSFTASPSGTASGIKFFFDDGTAFIRGASIDAAVDGTAGTNDMPGRLVFSTTADGASSPTERMRIASTGQFTATIADMTGASPSAFYVNTTAKAAQTGSTTNILSAINTDSTFISTGTVLRNFYATQGTFAVAPITQVGFYAHSTLTGATNNYGFQGTLASATNTYNLYMSGTADNYFAGNVGIGTSSPSEKLHISGEQFPAAKIETNSTSSGDSTLNLVGYRTTDSSVGYLKFWNNATSTTELARIVSYREGADNTGNLRFYTSSAGSLTERMRIDSSGNVLVTNPAGLGYGTGSGGTVTQATNKSTAVTLNKPTGKITMNNAALAAGAAVSFQLTNSICTTTDTMVVANITNSSYRVEVLRMGSGFGIIQVTNITGGSLSEAIVINFAIIKGATA